MKIGTVSKPRGIKGELKVLPVISDISTFSRLTAVLIGQTRYTLTNTRIINGAVYVALQGINDMDSAERLRGLDVIVPDAELPPLPRGRYYVRDLVGLKLLTEDGENLGKIKSIDSFGAADVITVKKDGKNIMFPYLNAVVKTVDIANGTMMVDRQEFLKVCVDED